MSPVCCRCTRERLYSRDELNILFPHIRGKASPLAGAVCGEKCIELGGHCCELVGPQQSIGGYGLRIIYQNGNLIAWMPVLWHFSGCVGWQLV